MAAACANAVLDVVLEDGFLDRVIQMGNLIEKELTHLVSRYPSVITGIRGEGMMWGLKCGVPNGELVAKALDHGLLTVPAGDNVVRFLPPLIVDENHVREAMVIIEHCAQEFANMKTSPRHFLELKDIAAEELRRIIDMGTSFKRGESLDKKSKQLSGRACNDF